MIWQRKVVPKNENNKVHWQALYQQLDKFLVLLSAYNFEEILNFLEKVCPPIALKQPIVFVEGNIAVGKTSFLHSLTDPRILKIDEPVDVWNAIICSNNKSIFVNYYERASKACGIFLVFLFPVFPHFFRNISHIFNIFSNLPKVFEFQLTAIVVRYLIFAHLIVPARTSVIAAERSPFSDELFFDLNIDDCPKEYRADYKALLAVVQSKFSRYGFLFLEADSTAQLLNNIKKRNRPGEEKISEDYLNSVNTAYEIFQQRAANLTYKISRDGKLNAARKKKTAIVCCASLLCRVCCGRARRPRI